MAPESNDLVRTITANLPQLGTEELLAVARLTTALSRIRDKRARMLASALSKLWAVVDTFEVGASVWHPDHRGGK